MRIRDHKLASKVSILLPGVKREDGQYCYSETWRLAARSAIFRQLNTLEDAAMEARSRDREAIVSQACDNIGALLSFLELSHQWLVGLASNVMLDSDHSPERRVLQMGRAG